MVRYATNDDFTNSTSFQENISPPAYNDIFPNNASPNTNATSSDTNSAQKSTDSDGQNVDQSQDRNNNNGSLVVSSPHVQLDADSIRIDIPFEQLSSNGILASPGGAVPITLPAMLNRTNDEELKPPKYEDAINMQPIWL